MDVPVTVIIPMYNVGKFIDKCATQLFEQSLNNIEFIFVDDCSPDNSSSIVRDVLKRYPGREPYVEIIKHEVNKGLPSARNTGISVARGEYIFHCDGDDWLETDAMESLLKQARTVKADIVWCDWYLSFSKQERFMSQNPEMSNPSSKQVLELILGGKLKYNVWNKLVKKSLYIDHAILFPDGYGMGEDMTMIKLFAVAGRVSYLDKALYHYVQLNNEAFTKKTNDAHFDQIKHNVDDTVKFLRKYFGTNLETYIHFFKLNVKLPFLISDKKESYSRWLSWFPESNSYIDKNPLFNTRIRLVQKAALRHHYWFLRMHYYLLSKVVYGFIYK